MKKITILIVLSILLNCCKTTESPVGFKFKTSAEDVTLFFSEKRQTFWAISLPFNLEIENPSSKKLSFRNYTYLYGNGNKGGGMKLYIKKEGKLFKQRFSDLKDINSNSTISYVVRSKHSIDSTKVNTSFFKPYIEKIKNLNQDSLNIGTIPELEAEHQGLLESLVQNDSVFFLFVNENSSPKFRRETVRVGY